MGDCAQTMWTFHGNSLQSLDGKGRVTVPSRWRFDGLETLLALPDDAHPALRLMPPAVLNDILTKLESDPSLTEEDRLPKVRYHSSRAFECPLDKQGRLLLPSDYVTELKFAGRVMLIGAWRHLEIWRPERWAEHFAALQSAHAAGALRLNR
jgi:MraZ protein